MPFLTSLQQYRALASSCETSICKMSYATDISKCRLRDLCIIVTACYVWVWTRPPTWDSWTAVTIQSLLVCGEREESGHWKGIILQRFSYTATFYNSLWNLSMLTGLRFLQYWRLVSELNRLNFYPDVKLVKVRCQERIEADHCWAAIITRHIFPS